jgi:MFS family permease
LGLGGEWGAGMVLFNEAWSPTRRGLGSGMIQSSFLAGQSLAGLVVAAVISASGPRGWHLAMMTGMVPALLIILIRFWMPESRVWEAYDQMRRSGTLPPEKRREGAGLMAIFRHRLSARYFFLGLMLVGGYMFALIGVASFMPTLLIGRYHASVGVVGGITTTVLWIAIPFYILFGGISDGWGRKKAFIIPALMWMAGAVGIYYATRSTAPYPGSYWGWPVFDAYLVMYVGTSAGGWFGPWLAEIFPVEVRNTAASAAYMVGRGASAIATMIVPLFGAAGLANGMALVGIVGSVVMFAFGMGLPDARGRVFHAIEEVYGAESPSSS